MSPDLERLAQSGDIEAQIALGRRFEAEDNAKLARGWFARAAKHGSVAALRMLAINLLTRLPIMEGDGVNMIRSAAHKGDGEAAYVCAMLAAQDAALPNRWAVARECLAYAADRGFAPAAEQLAFLDTADVAALTGALPARRVFESPRIEIVENCATPEDCAWWIARASPRVERAKVYDQAMGGGRVEQARSNSATAFNIAQTDIRLLLLRARIAAIANVSPQGLEITSVLHYAPGESFEPHVDFLDPAVPGYAADLAANGQRIATFLLYLNEAYEGGETEFPMLDWRYRGRPGDALLFWNVAPTGVPDSRTLHAGLRPTSGEKWLLSQWIRQ